MAYVFLSPVDTTAYADHIGRDGFAIAPDIVSSNEVQHHRDVLDRVHDTEAVRRRNGTYGIRNLLAVVPEIRSLSRHEAIRALVEPVLAADCFAVRATFFDKIPGANWKIHWHQDSVIAVRERKDVPGFGPWAIKAGILQVQPPVEIPERMLAVRIHLDACDANNGALRVLAGTHRHGWQDHDAARWKAVTPEVCCDVPCGGALVMRPLLLHASRPAVTPTHRRVIHIEYAADDLPGGLEWMDRV